MSARPGPSNTAEGEARCEVHRLAATVAAHFGPNPDPVNTWVNTWRVESENGNAARFD